MTYQEFITGRYNGLTVHCVASGPSLRTFDYERLRGKTVIAVNHAFKMLPAFDIKVAIDANFFNREEPNATRYGVTLAPMHAAKEPGVINFRMASHFSEEPGTVYAYGSSGLAALTIALQGGSERVVLWGFDYCFLNGNHHATQGLFKHSQGDGYEHLFRSQISKFAVFPAEKIVNASADSALPYFKKISEADALNY